MSVRQENRYARLVITQGQAETDRKRELEALSLVRGQRPELAPLQPNATRRKVRNWMRRNAADFDTATALAEAANAALDLPPGAMDDDTHWVWEEAILALDLAAA